MSLLDSINNDFSKIFPSAYFLKYVKELNGVAVVDGSFGIPLSGEEHRELIKLLSNFVNNYGDKLDSDMEEIKEKILERENLSMNQPHYETEKKKIKGYVYFVSCNGLVKIGRTKNFKDRMDVYSVKSPFETKILHQIKTDDSVSLEKHFHTIFMDKRTSGEWFDLTDKDIENIKSGKYLEGNPAGTVTEKQVEFLKK